MSRIFTTILTLCVAINCILADTKIKKVKEDEPECIVTTTNGQLRGKLELDEEQNPFYCSFLSIPYAQPPVDDLRFEDPKPVKDWPDVREAVDDLPSCAQVDIEDKKVGVEDCLYLNVFTSELPTAKNTEPSKPVMVFIHGGGFKEGSGGKEWYSPDFLVPEGVVLVTINYRLGIFGFFSLKNETSKTIGNAGLKDQVMALTWVKKNINVFGGNPDSVTIFGESAGAASVHFHVLSTKSKGFFTRAIMQSGTALAPWVNGFDDNGVALAEILKKKTDDHAKMLEQLRGLTYEEILDGQIKLEQARNQIWGSPVNPTIESSHPTAFITKTPYEIITSGTYNDVTMMIGYNDAEGIAMDQKMRFLHNESRLISDFFELIPHDLEIEANSSIAKKLATELETFYYNGSKPDTKNMLPYIKIYTDVWFAYPAHRAAMEHAKHSTKPIYFYRFSADTELNVYKGRDEVSKKYEGASHCDELGYLFMTKKTLPIVEDSPEDIALKRMVKLWTSFAKDGVPTVEDFDWKTVSNKSLDYLDFTTEDMDMKENPDKANMDFWDDQYDKYFGSYAICMKSSPILVFMYFLVKLIY